MDSAESTVSPAAGVGAGVSRPEGAVDAEATWLRAAVGTIIRVHLLTGKTLVGQLLSFDGSTLVLKGATRIPLLVYTHGIAYLAGNDTGAES